MSGRSHGPNFRSSSYARSPDFEATQLRRQSLCTLGNSVNGRAEVLQLCYSIVFAFIGYGGIFTDYTKPRAPYSAPPKLYLRSTLPRSSEEEEVKDV